MKRAVPFFFLLVLIAAVFFYLLIHGIAYYYFEKAVSGSLKGVVLKRKGGISGGLKGVSAREVYIYYNGKEALYVGEVFFGYGFLSPRFGNIVIKGYNASFESLKKELKIDPGDFNFEITFSKVNGGKYIPNEILLYGDYFNGTGVRVSDRTENLVFKIVLTESFVNQFPFVGQFLKDGNSVNVVLKDFLSNPSVQIESKFFKFTLDKKVEA